MANTLNYFQLVTDDWLFSAACSIQQKHFSQRVTQEIHFVTDAWLVDKKVRFSSNRAGESASTPMFGEAARSFFQCNVFFNTVSNPTGRESAPRYILDVGNFVSSGGVGYHNFKESIQYTAGVPKYE
eukprot:IDg21326t1